MPLMDTLLQLYRVDAQTRGLRTRVDSARRYLDAQSRELDALVSRKEELQQRRRQLQATIHNLETEVAAADERLEKLRNELNGSVNSKQYNAVLEELNSCKEQRSQLEDQILTEMTGIESSDEESEELDGKIEERSKVRDHASAQLQERQADVGDRLTELEKERLQAADAVPSDALGIFESLADDYEGEAMAEVEELDRRNRVYSCGACNIQIPFEQVSVLMSVNDRLMQCTACQRILFIGEALKVNS